VPRQMQQRSSSLDVRYSSECYRADGRIGRIAEK
jgi:hypothetical protein